MTWFWIFPDIERFRISSHLLIAAIHRKASFLYQREPGQVVPACHLLSQIYFNHQINHVLAFLR